MAEETKEHATPITEEKLDLPDRENDHLVENQDEQ